MEKWKWHRISGSTQAGQNVQPASSRNPLHCCYTMDRWGKDISDERKSLLVVTILSLKKYLLMRLLLKLGYTNFS